MTRPDLLGLVVHLDQVVLDITAEQGPGTCSASRLHNGGPLQGIPAPEKQVLAIIGGL